MRLAVSDAVQGELFPAVGVLGSLGLAICLGYAVARDPGTVAVGTGVGAALVVIAVSPRLALFGLTLYEIAYGEVVRRVGDSTAPGIALFLATSLVLTSAGLRVDCRRRLRTFPGVLVAVWFCYAAIRTAGAASMTDGLLGLRAQFQPLLWLIACVMLVDGAFLRKALLALTPACAYEAYDFIHQVRVGADGLVMRGYTYGSSVRQIGSTLRAFGTFAYNAPAGETMALLFLAYLALLLFARREGRDQLLPAVGLLMCAICVGLSFDRTAVLTLIFGATLITTSFYKARPAAVVGALATVVFTLLAIAVFTPAAARVFLDSSSTFGRFHLWKGLLTSPSILFGNGTGTAGVSLISGGRGLVDGQASGGTVVVDNYYLTQLLQEGLLGLLLLTGFLWAAKDRISRHRLADALSSAVAGPVLAAITVAMLVTNLWEETATPFVAFMLLGSALADTDPP